MGLDCYVMKKSESAEEPTTIWYGRKTNEIHGWMQRESGVPAKEFNCDDLELTSELLDKLERDTKEGLLEPTTGFFFGGGNRPHEVGEDVESILKGARQAISEGYEVTYTSWW